MPANAVPKTWNQTPQADGKLHSAQPTDTTGPSVPVISVTAATVNGFTTNLVTPSVDPQSGIASYVLEFSTTSNNGPFTQFADAAVSLFPIIWTSGVASKQYWVRCKAKDASVNANFSTYSAVQTITTLAAGGGGGGGTVDTTNRFSALTFAGISLRQRSTYPGGGWFDLVGIDANTGISYPRAPAEPGPVAIWGGNAPHIDGIQVIADNLLTDTPMEIKSVPGPFGPNVNVLRMTMSAPYNPNVGGVSGHTMQNARLWWPSSSVTQGMIYMRKWVWMKGDIASRNPGFCSVYGTKTPTNSERHILGLEKHSYTWNQLVWGIKHDRFPVGASYINYLSRYLSPDLAIAPLQSGQTYVAPVPTGQWFKLEVAHKFFYGATGWFWMALTIPGSSDVNLRNGTQVFYESGAQPYRYNSIDYNQGWNPVDNEKMNRIYDLTAYSDMSRSPSNTWYWDKYGVELWRGWPSDATAHPAVS